MTKNNKRSGPEKKARIRLKKGNCSLGKKQKKKQFKDLERGGKLEVRKHRERQMGKKRKVNMERQKKE